MLGKREDALEMRKDIYSGTLRLFGGQHLETLREASNYAAALLHLKRYAEARSLMSKTVPVARRVAGEDKYLTLMMRMHYARALYQDEESATLKDVREAVETLEDLERTARRVLGSAHPFTMAIERELPKARAALRARETPSSPPPSGSV